jgi:hypothetical protein
LADQTDVDYYPKKIPGKFKFKFMAPKFKLLP